MKKDNKTKNKDTKKENDNQNIEYKQLTPTDLLTNDIDSFGQENMPQFNMNRVSSGNFVSSKYNSELYNIGKNPEGTFTEKYEVKGRLSKRLIFFIGIFILIGCIGYGLYYYLHKTTKKVVFGVNTKNMEINAGDILSLRLDEYATFKNIKATNCILDLKKVNSNKPGNYNYYIKCGKDKYKGKIKVVDKKVPHVITKFLVVPTGTLIKAEDFIVSCIDNSECKYNITNMDELRKVKDVEGIYVANLKITDSSSNSIEINEYVIITNTNYKNQLICSLTNNEFDDIKGSYDLFDVFLFDYDDYMVKMLENGVFYYVDDKNFNKSREKINADGMLSLEGVSGLALAKDRIISIKQFGDFSNIKYIGDNTYDSISDFYSSSGYSCVTR